MSQPINRHLVVLLLCVSSCFFKANAEGYQGRQQTQVFNVESGLSQSWVLALHVDRYGLLWVGTQNGLNRYDGYSFLKFQTNPLDSTSLCNNMVNSICEDNHGNLWVSTWGGLSYLDRSSGTFTSYFHNPNDNSSINHSRLYGVYCDRRGDVWVKTLESIDRFNPETNSFTRYPHYIDPLSLSDYSETYPMYEDSKGRFWVGTNDGLLLFDRDLGLFNRFVYDSKNNATLSSNTIRDIAEDHSGNIWVATDKGLNRMSSTDYGFTRYYGKKEVCGALPANDIHSLFIDSKGTMWVATSEGICAYSDKDGFSSKSELALNPEVYSLSISSIVEDQSGLMWMGGYSGLIKWFAQDSKFELYSVDPKGRNLFGNNMIGSIYEDKNGILWVGTWYSGLFMYNRENQTVVNYSSKRSYPYHIAADDVHAITPLDDGRVLIGTSNGIQVYNPATKSFADFFEQNGVKSTPQLKGNRIYAILEDADKIIWVASRMGLVRFDGKKIDHYISNPSDSTTLTANQIQSLAQDGEYLWVGTNHGLNRMHRLTGAVQRFSKKTAYAAGKYMSDDIISLYIDRHDSLWIGTDLGLVKSNKQTGNFRLFVEEHGLPNNTIYSILEDDAGDIWVSTNMGIARISCSGDSIYHYGIGDGLQDYEFNIGAGYRSIKGELFFGGVSGVNAFFSDSVKSSMRIPNIIFTRLEMLAPNYRSLIPLEGKKEIVIRHPFSLVSFEFALLDYVQPERNRFMYKLEGFDEDWIPLNHKNFAIFSSIPEGTYTLKVIGANSTGVWNTQGVSLKVIVKVQWWRTFYALLLYILLALIGVLLLVVNWIKNQHKKNRLLEERANAIREAEDQKEQLLLKNKRITDSISYAKRIQEALIPSEAHLKEILPNSFIMYKPKDIVSGDFFWVYELEDKVFVASIDCTGHGVPGAFMSIIGIELLRNIISERGINDPAEILNLLDQGIRDTFSKTVNDEASYVKDGMDVAFCLIDKGNRTLHFAGAFSNLYLIRENRLKEIKGQRFTVGFSYEQEKPQFLSYTESLYPDDMIYIFTDGYADQFGGAEGKKFKYRRFRHLLLSLHRLPLEVQKKHLVHTMYEWMGEHEQVDDILIIGFKPDLP